MNAYQVLCYVGTEDDNIISSENLFVLADTSENAITIAENHFHHYGYTYTQAHFCEEIRVSGGIFSYVYIS